MNDKEKNIFKPYEELTFSDDFMFGKTMEDMELCRDVIECLLGKPIGELRQLEGQKEFRFTSDGKPIRLDIVTRNVEGSVFDTEMQNLNKKKVESLFLQKRIRFYQSSIDMDLLNKGEPYWCLPESSILFICTFDPFGLELPVYTFRERCDEDSSLLLDDGIVKYFFNCAYKENDIPRRLKSFYEYLITDVVQDDELTQKIDHAVQQARMREEWRSVYMKERALIMELKEEGREEGREEGKESTQLISVKNIMKNLNLSAKEAMDALGFTDDEKKKFIAML